MEIIDCHANIGWDISNLRKNLIPVEQSFNNLLEKMDYYKVSKAITVPFPSPGGQFNENASWYDIENRYLIDAQHHSKRLIPFPGVNPNDKESVKNIKTLAITSNVKGIKFSHQIPMEFPIDKLIGHDLMKIVQDNGLIFMMHIGTGKERGADDVHVTLDYAIKVAQKYLDIKFIFCHLGRLHWSIAEALNLDNVFMDTAGLALHKYWKQFIALEPLDALKGTSPQEVIEKLVEFGHEDKLIFGSDEPYTDYKSEIGNIRNADISNNAKSKIFSENIKKLLGAKGLND